MATRKKMVEFATANLGTITDNSLTSFTQDTLYLPESGKTFRNVTAMLSACATSGSATAANLTSRSLEGRLGAAGYTAHTNSNAVVTSGEDLFFLHGLDLTSHFTTNWTGTSMTYDSRCTLDTAQATSPGFSAASQLIQITYDYDDTSSTQIKTVRIPLDAPVSNMATSKPGTATATIPNLSTELPEASKVFRDAHIVVRGNVNRAGTGDLTMTMQLDSTTAHTSGIFEGVANTDYYFQYVWECSSVLNTSASMGFYIWANATDFNHVQAWLVVTYEFDATASNDVFVSCMIGSDGGMGGAPTSSDFTRLFSYLDIQEPGTITTKQIAYYAYWDTPGVTAGLNMRVGTGSFVAYTDVAATLAGCQAAMCRNDSAFTLVRGLNTLSFDLYHTETAQDYVTALNGFFIVNYTAGKPSQGYGAANHTVEEFMEQPWAGALAFVKTISAWAPAIPSSEYRLSNATVHFDYLCSGTGGGFGAHVEVERLAAEDQQSWDSVAGLVGVSDFEIGVRVNYVNATEHFQRYPGDERPHYNSFRRDIETARRWRVANGSTTNLFTSVSLMTTYHSITYSVGGNVTNSAGGTVNLSLHNAVTGERLATTTRSGNGSYSFTAYDNTVQVYVDAYEDATHLMRTEPGYAT